MIYRCSYGDFFRQVNCMPGEDCPSANAQVLVEWSESTLHLLDSLPRRPSYAVRGRPVNRETALEIILWSTDFSAVQYQLGHDVPWDVEALLAKRPDRIPLYRSLLGYDLDWFPQPEMVCCGWVHPDGYIGIDGYYDDKTPSRTNFWNTGPPWPRRSPISWIWWSSSGTEMSGGTPNERWRSRSWRGSTCWAERSVCWTARRPERFSPPTTASTATTGRTGLCRTPDRAARNLFMTFLTPLGPLEPLSPSNICSLGRRTTPLGARTFCRPCPIRWTKTAPCTTAFRTTAMRPAPSHWKKCTVLPRPCRPGGTHKKPACRKRGRPVSHRSQKYFLIPSVARDSSALMVTVNLMLFFSEKLFSQSRKSSTE